MTKTMVVSLFALSLIAFTGIGYATFTAAATVTGTAYAGTVSIEVTNISGVTCYYNPNVYSISGLGTSAASFATYYYAPGDYCTATVTLQNNGNIAELVTASSGVVGGYFTTSDTGPTPSVIAPGGTATDTITITLPSGLGNGAEGTVSTVTWTYTASAGS